MELVFKFFVIPVMLFCLVAALCLVGGVNPFEKLHNMYKRLTNKDCREGRHDFEVDEYMFYEFDDAHLKCKHCGHYKFGPPRQGHESTTEYLQKFQQNLVS